MCRMRAIQLYRIVLMVFRWSFAILLKRNHVYNSNVYICFVAAALAAAVAVAAAAAAVVVVYLRVISVCA